MRRRVPGEQPIPRSPGGRGGARAPGPPHCSLPRGASPAVFSRFSVPAHRRLPWCRHGLRRRLRAGEGEITLQAANGPSLPGFLSPLRPSAAAAPPGCVPPTPAQRRRGAGARHSPPVHSSVPQPLDSSASRAPRW